MRKFLLISLAAAFMVAAEPAAPQPPNAGAKAKDFTIRDVDGGTRSLSDFKSKKVIVIVFIGTECPLANLYVLTLADMQQKYASKGVQFLAINSNEFDTLEQV